MHRNLKNDPPLIPPYQGGHGAAERGNTEEAYK